MIDEIRDQRITVIIPTLERKKLVGKFIESYIKNCKIKTDFVMVNQNEDKKSCTDETASLILNSGNSLIDFHNEKKSLPLARQKGIDIACEIGNEIVFQADDDCRVTNMDIEKMIAPVYQDDRFGVCGSAGGYQRFYHDFKENQVRFRIAIGVIYCIKLSTIKSIGKFDENIRMRDDFDYQAQIWEAGKWVGIVKTRVKHKRHASVEKGERSFTDSDSDIWIKDNKYIAQKHPTIFEAKKTKLYKKIKLPNIIFEFDERLNLHEI